MEPAEKKPPAVSDLGAWGMNVVSSVGLIMANKQLMSSAGYAFSFATTLTGFHFTVTALVGWISKATGYSASKHVPLWELVWFSLVANASITGMNLSLMLNSVGFYQISKLSMIPVVCIMEWVLNSKHYTTKVISAVVVVAAGVGICTVTDVEVNAKGFICACVAVFCTSLQQITIGSFQKKYNIGSFELLSKTAPIQAVSLIILGPFVDYYLNGRWLLNYSFSTGATFFILLSCSLAVFCNMSQYLCIGRFSATSFQVLGHMKTVCVLILGWVLFDSALTIKNILGMLLAIMGMVVYSWAMESEKKATSAIPRNKSRRSQVCLTEVAKVLQDGRIRHWPHGNLALLQYLYWEKVHPTTGPKYDLLALLNPLMRNWIETVAEKRDKYDIDNGCGHGTIDDIITEEHRLNKIAKEHAESNKKSSSRKSSAPGRKKVDSTSEAPASMKPFMEQIVNGLKEIRKDMLRLPELCAHRVIEKLNKTDVFYKPGNMEEGEENGYNDKSESRCDDERPRKEFVYKEEFDFDDLHTPGKMDGPKDGEEYDVNSHGETPYYCTPRYLSSFKGDINDPILVPEVSDKMVPSSLRTDEIASSEQGPL